MAKAPMRNHQFDLMRIVFSIAVLLSHAPELTDGSTEREFFFRFTHHYLKFGSTAVYGFFLLSGFLIVQSWQHDPDLVNFLRKRVLRIVPGYLVAALLATGAVGLLAPGVDHFFRHLDVHFVKSLIALNTPATPPVLPGMPNPEVDASMWTISYEMRCYVLLAICGLCGLLRRPAVWFGLTLLLSLSLLIPVQAHIIHWPQTLWTYIGDPSQIFYLIAIYCVGVSFYVLRRWIVFRALFVLVAAALCLLVNWLYPPLDRWAAVVCGGYMLFYFGQVRARWLDWMRHVPDISYGIYLYGWPVESLWIYFRHGSPWVAFLGSTLICTVLGWLSWHLVERPMLKLKRRPTAALPTG